MEIDRRRVPNPARRGIHGGSGRPNGTTKGADDSSRLTAGAGAWDPSRPGPPGTSGASSERLPLCQRGWENDGLSQSAREPHYGLGQERVEREAMPDLDATFETSATLITYTRLGVHDRSGALERLPSLWDDPEYEQAAALREGTNEAPLPPDSTPTGCDAKTCEALRTANRQA